MVRFFLVLCIFVAAITSCIAQSSAPKDPILWLGAFGDFSLLYHGVDFRSIPGCPTCGTTFSNTIDRGYTAGLLIELPLAKQWRIQTRGGFGDISTLLKTSEQSIGNTLIRRSVPPFDTASVPVSTEYSLDAGLSGFFIEPSIGYEIIPRLFARVGFSATFLTTKSFSQRENIISPQGTLFNNDRSFRNDTSGTIPNTSPALLHGVLGINYDFPLSTKLTASPEIRLLLPFNNISSDLTWVTTILQVGATLKYTLFPPPDIIIKRDTVILRDTIKKFVLNLPKEKVSLLTVTRDVKTERIEYTDYYHVIEREHYLHEIPKTSKLEVSVIAFGIDPQGKREITPTIRIEETETEEQFPLLPHVFFPEGNADLNKTVMQQIAGTEKSTFTETSLTRNTLEIYAHLLNIIGSRMRQKPEAAITITGVNNGMGEDTLPNVSRNRANAVKEYLTEFWGIESRRINTSFRALPEKPANNTTVDGQVENRRAEISANDPDILKPVSLREIVVTATPPIVEIVPKIVSDSGIVHWTVDVEQSMRPLRNYNGKDYPLGILQWNLAEQPMPELETPVQIELKAEDKIGMTATARQSLKVQQLTLKKKRYELHNDKKIERFALIVFDFNSASLGTNNQRIVQDIRKRIQSGSQVIIAGYADRSGEMTYNQTLALKRCQEVKNALGLPDNQVKLDPVGSAQLLYDNESPQGRSYSRTVQIIVETPITE